MIGERHPRPEAGRGISGIRSGLAIRRYSNQRELEPEDACVYFLWLAATRAATEKASLFGHIDC